jgi:hypothetical protein
VSSAKNKADDGMDEVVRSLAGLLIRAAPLARLLNSAQTPAVHRADLRTAVGHERFVALTNALNAMSSWRAWEQAHAPDAETRRQSHQ